MRTFKSGRLKEFTALMVIGGACYLVAPGRKSVTGGKG
jgi:hypothetical protein